MFQSGKSYDQLKREMGEKNISMDRVRAVRLSLLHLGFSGLILTVKKMYKYREYCKCQFSQLITDCCFFMFFFSTNVVLFY